MKQKKCSRCGELRNINLFSTRENGLIRAQCKECMKEMSSERYKKNKEIIIEKVKTYYYNNWEKRNSKKKEWIENNKEKVKEYKRKYYKKYYSKDENRIKKMAMYSVHNALRRGELQKPTICEKCKAKSSRIEAHHNNGYEKENALNVIWLCVSCHKKIHNTRKYGYNNKIYKSN